MRFYFYHLYHSFAWSYDFVANFVSSGNWFVWVKTLIQFLDIGDSVLEIGFGTGVLQETLLKNGYDISGIDESPQMVRICKNRSIEFRDNLKIVRGTALDMPFQDNYFDKVVASFPGDYFLENNFIFELERILKPNGKFIALYAVKFNRTTFLDWFYGIIFRVTNQQINTRIEDELTKRLNKFGSFTSEILWKNCDGRSLCYVTLSRF